MKFALITFFASLALAILGFAAPAPNPATADVVIEQRSPNAKDAIVNPEALAKRDEYSVVYCPGINFTSKGGIPCRVLPIQLETCTTLPENIRYTVSSIRPLPGMACRIYTSEDCTIDESPEFSYPDLASLDDLWNNNVGSIMCSGTDQ